MAVEDLLTKYIALINQKQDVQPLDDNMPLQLITAPTDTVDVAVIAQAELMDSSTFIWAGKLFDRGSFARASGAYDNNGVYYGPTLPRFGPGPFPNVQGMTVEEATTNLVYNSDFETVTGTGILFSDPLTSGAAWTVQGGSFTFGASGATVVTSGLLTAGNPNWKPMAGSGGQNLALIAQATFTEPATVSTTYAGGLNLYTDINNRYALSFKNGYFWLSKYVAGTGSIIASTTAVTISANTSYTAILSLDKNGLLTAKLYQGTNTSGTLLATITATDTSLSGGFSIAVGGDVGVVIQNASVTGPWPSVWILQANLDAFAALVPGNNSSYAVRLSAKSGGNNGRNRLGSNGMLVVSTQYTISAYVRRVSGTGYLQLAIDGTGTFNFTNDTSGNWIRVILTVTTGSSSYNTINFFPDTAFDTWDIDSVQVEQKAYPTSYMRNDSTTQAATRNAEALTISAAGVLTAVQGTIELRVIPNFAYSFAGANRVAISAFKSSGSNGYYWLGYNTDVDKWGVRDAGLYSAVQSFAMNTVFGLALTWDANNLYLYVNGVFVATVAKPADFALASDGLVHIGCYTSPGYEFDGLIADLHISSIARSASDILAGYQSGQPLPVDQYTTCKLNLNGDWVNTAILPANWKWGQGKWA